MSQNNLNGDYWAVSNDMEPSARKRPRQKSTEIIERRSDQLICQKTIESNGKEENFAQDEKVLVFEGTWMYYACILHMDNAKNTKRFRVHYEGFSSDDDQTVEINRIMKVTEEVKRIKLQMEALDESGAFYQRRNSDDVTVTPAEYLPKEQVIVFAASEMYGAKILESTKDNESTMYKVRYNGWNQKFDEWIGNEKIIKRTPASKEIQLKLKKYKNRPITKSKENIASNKRNGCKKKAKDNAEIRANVQEIGDVENGIENGNKSTLSNLVATLNSFATDDQEMKIDNSYEKYLSKRSMAKKYEKLKRRHLDRMKEVEEENKKLQEENEELKLAAIYHMCQKCKKIYSSFKKNVAKKGQGIQAGNMPTKIKEKNIPTLVSDAGDVCQHVNDTATSNRTNNAGTNDGTARRSCRKSAASPLA